MKKCTEIKLIHLVDMSNKRKVFISTNVTIFIGMYFFINFSVIKIKVQIKESIPNSFINKYHLNFHFKMNNDPIKLCKYKS